MSYAIYITHSGDDGVQLRDRFEGDGIIGDFSPFITPGQGFMAMTWDE